MYRKILAIPIVRETLTEAAVGGASVLISKMSAVEAAAYSVAYIWHKTEKGLKECSAIMK